jgi:NAD(P)-dependent dehydrogenase (short-subunit alcohol dehydrogenase family)
VDAEPESSAVFITGASSGIGAACTARLVAQGWRVFAGVLTQGDGDALAERIQGKLTPVVIDVTDAQSIAHAAEEVAVAVGDAGLRGLVNCAGIAITGPLECLPIAALRRQLEVNVIGTAAVTQAFLPLVRQGSGRIATIGSIMGRFTSPYLGPYAASKHALEALTDALRQELSPWAIPVVLIQPGAVNTTLWDTALAASRRYLAELPAHGPGLYEPTLEQSFEQGKRTMQRGTQPEEVAAVVTRALMAGRPKTRYLVGTDARIIAVLKATLPDRLFDGVVRRLSGA